VLWCSGRGMGGSIVRKYVFKFRGWVLIISLTAACCTEQAAAVRMIPDTQQGGGGCSRKLITNP
jgi:hypothetical protein